ncbi:uncharacterized protein K02A2.6-like [Mercenaria mercenaria]|uniref:uncharacterized protein K02A2.6-like n=1 Tax=Mercenaria mercenaria TaxID=6596 RepID=UPI00234F9172|nr:uncharacterized protein K02A2.6-like [Mercenaria mercenaria]
MDIHVHAVMSNFPVSDQKMRQIRDVTETDPQSRTLKQTIFEGWPDQRTDCPESITEFWNFRDEMSVVEDIILKGSKIYIPKGLRSEMLDKIHSAHLGIEKCTQRAKEIMFWPKMFNDIKQRVMECPVCLEHRSENVKEPMIQTPLPDRPWQTVATDIFTWQGKDFIVLVDYYSRYFELSQLTSTRAQNIIQKLKSYFSRHGIPETLISDNASYYTCQSFADFAREWDFNHRTSSPTYSQSNGLAEKFVSICKNLLTKSTQAGTDPYIALLEYRNTPLACGKTPAQLLMSRQLRSILPVMDSNLEPRIPDKSSVRNKMQNIKNRSKFYYDRSARPMKSLEKGEGIRIRQGKTWQPAVVSKQVNDRSYIVRTEDGGMYRRNRRHLLKSHEKPFDEIDFPSLPATPPAPPLNFQTPQPSCPKISPDPIKQENVTNYNSNPDSSALYQTRSGRNVRPPDRLNL